eukprot:scaffold13643_cov110-Isochrysis_galbana.AAC.7
MPHGAVPGSDCVLFRDSSEVDLGAGVKPTVGANSYAAKLSPPAFVLCEKDIWDPREDIAEEELTAVDVTAAERRKRARKAASTFLKRRINAVRVTRAAPPQPRIRSFSAGRWVHFSSRPGAHHPARAGCSPPRAQSTRIP